MSATRADLVRRVSSKTGLTQRPIDQVVRGALEAIGELLSEAGRLELRDFGAFEVRRIKAHETVEPRTGETVLLPESITVDFKPGKRLRETLRGGRERR